MPGDLTDWISKLPNSPAEVEFTKTSTGDGKLSELTTGSRGFCSVRMDQRVVQVIETEMLEDDEDVGCDVEMQE